MINEKIANLASKIASELIAAGFITEEQHEPTIKIIADAVDVEVHPVTCADCGTLLCPACAGHTEPGMKEASNENEALPVCPYCGVYVKEDRTTSPAIFGEDRRFTKVTDTLTKLFGGNLPTGTEQ
jgi:hypothetical protein